MHLYVCVYISVCVCLCVRCSILKDVSENRHPQMLIEFNPSSRISSHSSATGLSHSSATGLSHQRLHQGGRGIIPGSFRFADVGGGGGEGRGKCIQVNEAKPCYQKDMLVRTTGPLNFRPQLVTTTDDSNTNLMPRRNLV